LGPVWIDAGREDEERPVQKWRLIGNLGLVWAEQRQGSTGSVVARWTRRRKWKHGQGGLCSDGAVAAWKD
jgi:hypothetical protein